MGLLFKNIIIYALLTIFIFFSLGSVNLIEKEKTEGDVCSLLNNCSCCSMKKSESPCCSNHQSGFSTKINVPCSHPGYDDIHLKLDPSIKNIIAEELVIVLTSSYMVSNTKSVYYAQQISLFKPPPYNTPVISII
ncbi:MAG: hypothetical protein R6W90_00080 [Ignavibacteriaceae bacterium]